VCIGADGYPTLDAVFLRFAIAAGVLLPLAARARPWPRGTQWVYIVLAGWLDATAYLLVYLGEERVSGGVAAVLYGTQPLILAVILRVTNVEVLTRRHLVGAAISLLGVALLFLDRLDVSARQAAGVAMVIGSVLAATSYSVVMKRHASSVPNVVSTALFIAITAAVLGIVALAVGQPIPWPPPVAPSAALVYLALIGTVAAFLLYFWLLGKTGLQVTSTLVFVFPIVALVTDALFEHEVQLGMRAYLGVAITLGGLGVSLRRAA
jgi:drug/metabolite transporter (DMT)-like permease